MNHNEFKNCVPTDSILLEDEAEGGVFVLEENLSTAKLQMQSPSKPLLYKGKDAEGFDLSAGRTWIYPMNYPVRQYQYDIVSSCLFKNTLVSLPTGLGKTFIAAVVMYNFYRWFPRGKVVFMAPTKPLVHQQIESCYKVMGIPKEDTAEMTGSMSRAERAAAWGMKRVFFLTPQVLTNDLTCAQCPAASIKCVVVDEAHKALGNHSYCQVMKALWPFNNKFRVLALSATPGNDMQAVKQVLRNLMISHVELRNEDSPDVAVFTHKRNVETIVVALGSYLLSVRERFMLILDRYLTCLVKHKALFGSTKELTKFGMLKARDVFRQNPPSSVPRGQFGIIEANFAVCITLLHSLELLSLYGLRSFKKFLQGVLNEDRGQAVVHSRLKNDGELEKLLDELNEKLGPDNQAEPEPDQSLAVPHSGLESVSCVYSHPKVEKVQEIVMGHFRSSQEKGIETRAMIFCQYRDIVIEVCQILRRHHPLVKPMTFVGQSSVGKQSKGFTQKQQLKVMQKFKAGGYNVLISTCVGEEGLDIGEVDLIVCFDAHKSPVRLVQRMGRTGRQREGRIVMLVTEGKEHAKFKASMYQNHTVTKKLLEGDHIAAHMYENNPRMIPPGIYPHCHRMFMKVCASEERQVKTAKRRNHDIRKLLVNASSSKEIGLGVSESTSPYCMEDELAKFWDGKMATILAFDKFRDVEELHAKERSELCLAFSEDLIACKRDESQKLDLGKWLQWQQTLQASVLVEHTVDSKMLSELLQYAENKRCQVQLSQTAGLLSQVNTSLMWPSKRNKRRCPLKRRVLSSVSVPELCGRKDEVTPVPVSGVGPLKPDTAVISSCTPLLQTTAKVADVETARRVSDTKFIEISDDQNNIEATTEQKAVSPKKDVTNDDLCYFCKNSLFCCHHIMSCVSTIKNTRGNGRFYKNLDLGFLNNFTEADMIAFDLKQLLSPLDDRNIDISVEEDELPRGHDCEHASEAKPQKYEGDVKLNFNLDFSVFEQCLFGEETIPENSACDFKSEMATSEVCDHALNVNAGLVNMFRNSAFIETESPIRPGTFSKTEHTPVRSRQIETNFSHKGTPSNLLISSVSPIFGSLLKKHIPESPILGCALKKSSKNSTRMLPVSTPKVHKKTLFSRNIMFDTVQEEGDDFILGISQHSKTKDDGSVNTLMVHDCDQQLNSPLSEGQALPRPNFDLFSVAQDIGILEPDVDSGRNADSFTSNTMYTVTQMLGLVDKKPNTRGAEPVNASISVQDIVPRTSSGSRVTEDVSKKGNKCSDSVNGGSVSNVTSPVRNSAKMVTSSLLSSLTGQTIPTDYEQKPTQADSYLHDSDDDIFVDLALDDVVLTSCKQGTSEMESVNNVVKVEPNLVGNIDRSEHKVGEGDSGKQGSDAEFTSPLITKISKCPTVGNSAVSRLSRSCLSSKRKLKDSPEAMGSKQNVSSSDPEARHFDKESLSKFIRDEIQLRQVSLSVAGKQKDTSRSVGLEDQLDNQKTVPFGSSVASIHKDLSSDDSLILKPSVRNRKINISSASNESRELSPYSTQSKLIEYERMKESRSPREDSFWFTARKSKLNTSPSSNSPRLLSEVKKHRSSNGNKSMYSSVPVVKNDTEISSEEESYFKSPRLVRLKKRNQSKSAFKTGRYNRHRRNTPVNKKLKHGLPRCAFVETEAEESGSCSSSDDDTSGLDDYDSSFVNDSGDNTHTDIQAKFLHSLIRSPGSRQGHFKIPTYKPPVPLEDVFSQVEAEFETSYLEDSFCVNEEAHTERMETSVLEQAEAMLEAKSNWKRRKRKRTNSCSVSDCVEGNSGLDIKRDESKSRKRRRRILMLDSSDSDTNSQAVNKVSASCVERVQEQIAIPAPKIHTGTVNTDSAHIDTECLYMKSVGCGAVGQNRAPTKTSVCKTEAEALNDDWDCDDWNFDNLELSSFKEVCVGSEYGKVTVTHDSNESKGTKCLSSAEEGMAPTRKFVSKAVRSLTAEFNKETISTLVSGNSVPRQLACIDAGKSALSPPESSIAGLPEKHQFKVLSNAVLEACSNTRSSKTVIMATRQVASAPEIATGLRAVHNINVLVRSITEADYVISWQLGVLRVMMADFLRACPNKSGLAKAVRLLQSEFMRHVLVVENDKHTPLSTYRAVWTKVAATQLAYLRHTGVSVLYSHDKADTVRLLAALSESEHKQNRAIILLPKGTETLENNIHFYQNLPGVNTALALRLCQIFSCIMDFLSSCNSVQKIQEVLGLDSGKAVRIHLVLCRIMKPRATEI